MTDQRGQQGIDTVYSELETVSRRAVARARHKSAPLSFVEHSLVTFIAAHPGCRATDIAADFGLNRSTVSRQLAGLVQLGLVEPGLVEPGPAVGGESAGDEAAGGEAAGGEARRDEARRVEARRGEARRGQALALTDRGRDVLARSVEANRSALADRLEGWTGDEVDALAAALHRLNSAFVD